MNRKTQRREGKDALEMLEESVHLLRRMPGRAFASYYAGSAFFVLGFLYFWADMSRGAFAGRHAAEAAFFLSLLFLWMKCWQTVFTRQARAALTGDTAPSWTFRKILRLILTQTAIQPAGLLLLPAALLLTLPFGWVYAYYQNVTVFGDGTGEDLKAITRKARKQAMLFQKQNHLVLAVLALFGIFVFLNMANLLYLAPRLLRTLSGVETVFTRASWSMLNTTFLAAAAAMTYLAVDPVVKSVYVLRCFYGESILTGEDLKADLKNIRFTAKTVTAALAVFVVMIVASPAAGQDAISADKLDRSINEVISKPQYAWRMPREKQGKDQEAAKGPFAKFIKEAVAAVKGWLRTASGWIGKAFTWIFEKIFGRIQIKAGERPPGEWPHSVFILLYMLLAVAASVLAVMLLRIWRRRKSRGVLKAGDLLRTPDLTREDVAADALPPNRWVELGRDLMKRGDLRLALRAFYLASLSRLAEQGRITIALFKSNREYERELGRKAHTLPELVTAFSQNVGFFERTWYGMHDVTAEVMQRFTENQERIMANAEES